ncbi:MAG: MbnP family protein, partial [Bacteroidota bacterium]
VVTDVDLSFRANFGDEPLIMNQEYDYDDDLKLFFSKFNFYISDLALLTEDCISGQIELTDIELIDFTDINTSDQAARDGFRLKFTNIPTGEYAGIRLSIGVSPELNREEPAVFSTSHPLGNPSQYWEGWKSYIFSKVEGRADTDQDGSFDLGYAYHMGGNAAFREICLLKNISLQEDQRTELDLNIDLRQLFITDDTTFDIETTPGTHTEEGLNTSVLLMDNFEEAFDIE